MEGVFTIESPSSDTEFGLDLAIRKQIFMLDMKAAKQVIDFFNADYSSSVSNWAVEKWTDFKSAASTSLKSAVIKKKTIAIEAWLEAPIIVIPASESG